jgi:hypothetical protein
MPHSLLIIRGLKVSRKKRGCVKKRNKRSKSSETSTPMAPGRVMAPTPVGSERMLEGLDTEETAPTRMNRQKAKETPIVNPEESPLHDVELQSNDEVSVVRMDISPVAPSVVRSQRFESHDFPKETEQPMSDEGKFM